MIDLHGIGPANRTAGVPRFVSAIIVIAFRLPFVPCPSGPIARFRSRGLASSLWISGLRSVRPAGARHLAGEYEAAFDHAPDTGRGAFAKGSLRGSRPWRRRWEIRFFRAPHQTAEQGVASNLLPGWTFGRFRGRVEPQPNPKRGVGSRPAGRCTQSFCTIGLWD